MADPTYKFTGVNAAQLANEVQLLRQNSSSGVPRLDRYRTLAAGSLIVLSLLSFPTGGHAQQGQASQVQGSAVPTLEALPHQPLPRGEFKGWCGLSDKVLMMTDQGIQIFNSDGVAATTHFFSEHAKLKCGDDGRRMVRIDNHDGHAAEYDIASGDFTRLLVSYANSQGKSFSPTISFSPDLKSVATDGPLTLGPGVTDLKVVQISMGYILSNGVAIHLNFLLRRAWGEPRIAMWWIFSTRKVERSDRARYRRVTFSGMADLDGSPARKLCICLWLCCAMNLAPAIS
jgi:hypothetical protein